MAATTGLWRRNTGRRIYAAATCVAALWSTFGCAPREFGADGFLANEFGTGGWTATIFGVGRSADQQCFRAGFTETETDALRRQVQLELASDPEALAGNAPQGAHMRLLASCSETYPTLDCTPCVQELVFEETLRLRQEREQ